ncbi:MAG: sigma-70 family RNA polymerase sigma factor [Bacteroidetes bacterium]|nr:MAG: sigma-70 family RNA polymerase sigma factor [Bacteroidota bacterium]
MVETVNETNIVDEFLNGSDIAFVRLYNRYKHSIYLFSLKMLNDDEQAKDAVQNVFLKAYERRDQLRRAECFKSWIFTIARNECYTFLRKEKEMFETTDDYEDCITLSSTLEYDTIEQHEILNHALERLRARYREVIILKEYDGFSYKEIAGIVQSTESAVKSLLFKARKSLATLLQPILDETKHL